MPAHSRHRRHAAPVPNCPEEGAEARRLGSQERLQVDALRAKTHADAMASGMNLRTGAVISIVEGGAISIQPVNTGISAATPTPIEAGQVDVHATVTLEVEITQ